MRQMAGFDPVPVKGGPVKGDEHTGRYRDGYNDVMGPSYGGITDRSAWIQVA